MSQPIYNFKNLIISPSYQQLPAYPLNIEPDLQWVEKIKCGRLYATTFDRFRSNQTAAKKVKIIMSIITILTLCQIECCYDNRLPGRSNTLRPNSFLISVRTMETRANMSEIFLFIFGRFDILKENKPDTVAGSNRQVGEEWIC